MGYGLLTSTDVRTLEDTIWAAMAESVPGTVFRILEIGVCTGQTSRGMRDFCESKNIPLEYWGIDNQRDLQVVSPFPGANLVIGESAKVHEHVPGVFDVVLIDGCHCRDHVKEDFAYYGPKVRPGGYLLFHDTHPDIQGVRDPQHPDGPMDKDHHISVRPALEDVGMLPAPDVVQAHSWRLIADVSGEGWGGFVSFQRITT